MTKKGESIKKTIRALRSSLNHAKITETEAGEISDMINTLSKYIPDRDFADDQ